MAVAGRKSGHIGFQKLSAILWGANFRIKKRSPRPIKSDRSYDLDRCPSSFKKMEDKKFTIGQKVKLVAQPPYVKTAEPMPILRPPNVVRLGEEGIVLDRRPGGYWGVRFEKGAFLLDSQYIEAVDGQNAPPSPQQSN